MGSIVEEALCGMYIKLPAAQLLMYLHSFYLSTFVVALHLSCEAQNDERGGTEKSTMVVQSCNK